MSDLDTQLREARLDGTLADSFPASDPPSFTPITGMGRPVSRDTGSEVLVKRAYEPPAKDDGYRVLVDRIWPRGVSRDHLHVDEWIKQVAPTSELRRWYGHKVERWDEFRDRYLRELAEGEPLEAVKALTERARSGQLTLVVGARDADHSQGEVLRTLIEKRLKSG